jgi:hypothetical protein
MLRLEPLDGRPGDLAGEHPLDGLVARGALERLHRGGREAARRRGGGGPGLLVGLERLLHLGMGTRHRHATLRRRGGRRSLIFAAMSEHDDALERLSSPELHDLAVSHAKRHLDVRFFWSLMKYLPAAEAAAGEPEEANADIQRLSAHVDDVTDAGKGEVADLLRPFYLEYLREHDVAPRA